MRIVLFLGYSGSGKTTSIASLAKSLSSSGYIVGALKHIHEREFAFDKPGKDTWIYGKAGASLVVASSASELAIVQRRKLAAVSLDSLLEIFRRSRVDYLLAEGFYNALSKRRGVKKVICAKAEGDVAKLSRIHGRPLCILGKFARISNNESYEGIPLLSLPPRIRTFRQLIEE